MNFLKKKGTLRKSSGPPRGGLFTWGSNVYGQLACGMIGKHNATPAPGIGTKKDLISVTTAYNFGLAITKGGTLYSWGLGDSGQLGLGDKKSNPTPQKVSGLTKEVTESVTGNTHALALKGQTLYSWGEGANGKLGNGDSSGDQLTPLPVEAFKGMKVESFDCGAEHSAVIADGHLYTFGLGECGRLGHDGEENVTKPKKVDLGKDVPSLVRCGSDWTIVLCSEGQLSVFGYGGNGRLGTGSDFNRLSPTSLSLSFKVVNVSCGHDHCALLGDDGTLWTFGYGGNGRLGHGSELDEKSPRKLESLEGVTSVACGGSHTAAIVEDRLLTWGWNHFGQLGREGPDATVPTEVPMNDLAVTMIACGENHTIALVV